jgi:hypothetical protein
MPVGGVAICYIKTNAEVSLRILIGCTLLAVSSLKNHIYAVESPVQSTGFRNVSFETMHT